MKEEILEMSQKERERLVIIKRVLDKELSQVHAAKILKITERQIRNLVKAWKQDQRFLLGFFKRKINIGFRKVLEDKDPNMVKYYAAHAPTIPYR